MAAFQAPILAATLLLRVHVNLELYATGEAGFDGKSFDEPTATADEPANITEASGTTANGASDQYSDYGASDQYTSDGASDQYTDDGDTESTGAFEAGACNLIDGTVGYLMVVAIALLV
ncbi:hypothetical protein ACHAP8_007099 [Fusarium lateritium]